MTTITTSEGCADSGTGGEAEHIKIYLDESGELGQNEKSSRHILIALLVTDGAKKLSRTFKKEKKHLYDQGWPRNLEIKGNILHGCHHPKYEKYMVPNNIRDDPHGHIVRIINKILGTGAVPYYCIGKKDTLPNYLTAHNAEITYSFLAGTLICKVYPFWRTGPVTLYVDKRKKEVRLQMPFSGYVQTRTITECHHEHEFQINHEESDKVLGLQAADFISWGLFRHYERGDSRYWEIIEPQVRLCVRI